MSEPCPICGESDCDRTYPLMLARWAEGRDREHWRRVHDRQVPPLRTQVMNAAKSAARFVARGLPVVSADERARRLAICQSCPDFQDGRCLHCGCRVAAKDWLGTERCPINRW